MSAGPKYAPLTARHKRIFVVAGVMACVATFAIAFARFRLILWWIAGCPGGLRYCHAAELGFTWWWALLAGVVLTIAFVAHRLTLDRLRPAA